MGYSWISSFFKYFVIAVIYIIIVLALIIMYKDIKSGGKKKVKRKGLGLEIIKAGENLSLKKGSIIPVHGELTIGRKDDNLLKLTDNYVSSHHARVRLKNNEYVFEDMGSTNGSFLNDKKVDTRITLKAGDVIRIGTSEFKVIS